MDVTAPHSVAQCVDEIKRLDLAGDGFDFVVVCSGTRWVTEQGYGVEPDITTVSAGDGAELPRLCAQLLAVCCARMLCAAVIWTDGSSDVDSASTTAEHMLEAFKVNAIGPLLVTQNLVKAGLLKNPSLIANITSKMGSVMDNTSGGVYPYRSSKVDPDLTQVHTGSTTSRGGHSPMSCALRLTALAERPQHHFEEHCGGSERQGRQVHCPPSGLGQNRGAFAVRCRPYIKQPRQMSRAGRALFAQCSACSSAQCHSFEQMTGGNGLIDVDECVSGLISVIETKDADPDVWYDFAGRVIPW